MNFGGKVRGRGALDLITLCGPCVNPVWLIYYGLGKKSHFSSLWIQYELCARTWANPPQTID